jgi:hypothetical protein
LVGTQILVYGRLPSLVFSLQPPSPLFSPFHPNECHPFPNAGAPARGTD